MFSKLAVFQEELKGQKSTKLHKLILNGEVEEVEKLLSKGGGRVFFRYFLMEKREQTVILSKYGFILTVNKESSIGSERLELVLTEINEAYDDKERSLNGYVH